MQLYHIQLLWLILILLPLGWLLIRRKRMESKRLSSFAEEHFFLHYLDRVSPFLATLKYILAFLAMVFMILSLTRPQWDYKVQEMDTQGLDFMICLDLSRSMDATDMSPSRLIRAKLQLNTLIDALKNDRIGIIAFAGEATLECPLTDDYESARLVLSSLDTGNVTKYGTDVGAALDLARISLGTATGSGIVILISDGEDLSGSAQRAAARLAGTGVRIYCLGVGSDKGSTIVDPDTGEEAFSRADFASMTAIANTGNGKFFAITPSQNEIGQILDELYSTEPGTRRSAKIGALREQYHLFALFALGLLLLESIIMPLRRRGRSG